MWLEYFPHAFIYGVDIGEAAVCKGERHQVFQADQSDRAQLQRVIKAMDKPVFAIIDDGSHIPQHQVYSPHLLLIYCCCCCFDNTIAVACCQRQLAH